METAIPFRRDAARWGRNGELMKEAPACVMRRGLPVIAGAQTMTGGILVGRIRDCPIKRHVETIKIAPARLAY